METFLEILKFTIPALIVFATSYFILKQYLNNHYNLRVLELRTNFSKDAIPLKIKAYERLLLFCERISIPNLVMRLNTKAITKENLKNVMMISIQKEFEHNIAQQLYISNNLWQIINVTKNEMINLISVQADALSSSSSGQDLANLLIKSNNELKKAPVDIAIEAIKEEAKVILTT